MLKKEIQDPATNAKFLNYRYCNLMEKGQRLPAHEFSIDDAREMLWIEDELHARLIKCIGHDFYPPDRVEKKAPDNTLKAILEQVKPKSESGIKIKFHVKVLSSIGTKAAEFNVEANSKDQADLLARKQIRKLGLHGATHKIS